MKLETHIHGAALEPSSISSVSANASIDAQVRDISIEQIAGDINLRSKLKDGKLRLSFSPHFDWGVSFTKEEASASGRIDAKLKEAGLSDEQIEAVARVFAEEPVEFEMGEITAHDSKALVGDDTYDIPGSVEGKGISIPLPDIPVNLDPSIDVRNFKIENIGIGGNTTIEAENIATQPSALNDFHFKTDAPDIINFSSAEINDARVRPIEVPELSLPDLATSIEVPRVGATEMPINVESTTGGSDVRVRLLDWHPRWRREICLRVWRWKKCAWIEFGINLVIDLEYRWELSLLRIALKVRNAFINNIKIGIRITKVTVKAVRIGLLKVLKLLTRTTN